MVGLAALVTLGGRLSDVVGPRTAILADLWAMAIGAAGAALAPGFGVLVASLAVEAARAWRSLRRMIFPPALSMFGGSLADRLGARAVSITGLTVATLAFVWLGLFVTDQEYAILVPGFVLFGIGIPLAIISLLTAGAQASPESERGAAGYSAGFWMCCGTIATVAASLGLRGASAGQSS